MTVNPDLNKISEIKKTPMGVFFYGSVLYERCSRRLRIRERTSISAINGAVII